MKQKDRWLPAYWKGSPMFIDHQELLADCDWQKWPDCEDLNQRWRLKNRTLSNFTTRFVRQDPLSDQNVYYEQHIYNCGEIPTRVANWHDYFNAMIWLQFGQVKAAINGLHVSEMAQQEETQTRSRKRDALTLFDEAGAIFVTSDSRYIQALQNHQWKELFWHQREQWNRQITTFIFGHGLYEKMLNPYIGMTANALTLLVDSDFFGLPRNDQRHYLDQTICAELIKKNRLEKSRDLQPLPILGIPNWWPENDQLSFYENTQYFRPKREGV